MAEPYIKIAGKDYITNPQTNRLIKVGGKLFNKLMKDKMLKCDVKDDRVLYEIADEDTAEDIIAKKMELNEELGSDECSMVGRGLYKNKIVRRRKNPDCTTISKFASKIAKDVIVNNREIIDECASDDFESQLQKLIMKEMINIDDTKDSEYQLETENSE